jgi:hypothetical protein
MSIVTILDVLGVGFLIASAFNGNLRRTNSMGIGLSLIGLGHLILPLVH